jgi:hypothetical protein
MNPLSPLTRSLADFSVGFEIRHLLKIGAMAGRMPTLQSMAGRMPTLLSMAGRMPTLLSMAGRMPTLQELCWFTHDIIHHNNLKKVVNLDKFLMVICW